MRKIVLIAVLTAGILASVADAKPRITSVSREGQATKPRITGGNLPPLEKPRMTGGNNPPIPSPAVQPRAVECKAVRRFFNVRC